MIKTYLLSCLVRISTGQWQRVEDYFEAADDEDLSSAQQRALARLMMGQRYDGLRFVRVRDVSVGAGAA